MEALLKQIIKECAGSSITRSYLEQTRLDDLCEQLATKLVEKGVLAPINVNIEYVIKEYMNKECPSTFDQDKANCEVMIEQAFLVGWQARENQVV